MYKLTKILLTPIIFLIFCFSIVFLIALFLILNLKLSDFWAITLILIGFYLINWIIIITIFLSKRRIEVRLTWIFVVSIFPFVGFFCYLAYGRKYKFSHKNSRYNKFWYANFKKINFNQTNQILKFLKENNNKFYESFALGFLLSNRNIYLNSKIKLLYLGSYAWFNILNDLQNAKSYIFINYFIISSGILANSILKILETKLLQKVKVYIVYDHVGTYLFNNKILFLKLKKLKVLGLHLACFQPFILPFVNNNTNFRNHRKDIIIDGIIGYTGGINIGDHFVDWSFKYGLFYDVHARIEGEAVKTLELIFLNDWFFATKEKINFVTKNIVNNINKPKKINFSKPLNFLQIIDNGPNHKTSIHKNVLLNFINHAQKRIWISSPYFIPPNDIIDALIMQAKLDKDVRVILPGITDKIFLLSMSKIFSVKLSKNNVKIYLLNNCFNHAKMFLFDDEISIISTTNLDNRGLYNDYQTMTINYNLDTNKKFQKEWELLFKSSTLFDINEVKRWNKLYLLWLKFNCLFIQLI